LGHALGAAQLLERKQPVLHRQLVTALALAVQPLNGLARQKARIAKVGLTLRVQEGDCSSRDTPNSLKGMGIPARFFKSASEYWPATHSAHTPPRTIQWGW